MRHLGRLVRRSALVWSLFAAPMPVPLLAGFAAAGPGGSQSEGIVMLARQQRSLDTTGELRNVDVDTAQVQIAAAPPVGEMEERTAPRIPRRPLRREGTIRPAVLAAEVRNHFRDLEVCRLKVARAGSIAPSQVKAGEITLHWTILPSGATQGTLVFETTETDLALMKCIRRRMNGWRFTQPTGGPLHAEYDYRFASAGSGKSK